MNLQSKEFLHQQAIQARCFHPSGVWEELPQLGARLLVTASPNRQSFSSIRVESHLPDRRQGVDTSRWLFDSPGTPRQSSQDPWLPNREM